MPEEDEDAAEAYEAQEVIGVALVAYDQPAVVAQPRKQPLDLPAPPVSPQRPAVRVFLLRVRFGAIISMPHSPISASSLSES